MVDRIWLSALCLLWAERFLRDCRNKNDVAFNKHAFVEVVRIRHGGICIAGIQLFFLITLRLSPGVICVLAWGCAVVGGNTQGRGGVVMDGVGWGRPGWLVSAD